MVVYSWNTFEGKHVTLDTVDHQHLSNCYWFIKLFYKANDTIMLNLLAVIDRKFEGKLLPYKPVIDFDYEIQSLKNWGLLVEVEKFMHYEIWHERKLIGSISAQNHIEVEKLANILK